jgi:hypothetical protein
MRIERVYHRVDVRQYSVNLIRHVSTERGLKGGLDFREHHLCLVLVASKVDAVLLDLN